MRLRGRLYQHLTHAPGTGGLDWFATHYDRISALRGRLDRASGEAALHFTSAGVRLASLEVRTAPAESWAKIRDEVRDPAEHAMRWNEQHPAERTEIGMVLHFIKRHEWRAAGRAYDEHGVDGTGFRCGKWVSENVKRAMAVETALRYAPELLLVLLVLLVLRGVDVANRELAIPTFCLVPLYDRVRRASERAAQVLARSHPAWSATPLRATAHAGEEFHRVLEGIRRVHELVEFGLLRGGDRVGHAIALGMDARRTADDERRRLQPREERLDESRRCTGRGAARTSVGRRREPFGTRAAPPRSRRGIG